MQEPCLQVVDIFSSLFINARKYSTEVLTELILFQMLAKGGNFSFTLRELLYVSGKSTEGLFNFLLYSMRLQYCLFFTADLVWLEPMPSAEYLKQFVRGRLAAAPGEIRWGQANQQFDESGRASRHSIFSCSVYESHYGNHWARWGKYMELLSSLDDQFVEKLPIFPQSQLRVCRWRTASNIQPKTSLSQSHSLSHSRNAA